MGKKPKGIRADLILRQLQKRHTEKRNEVFFTEVKNGPTMINHNLMIMDAVAFKRSWTSPHITGYEVKVSRSDFTRDDKWPGYRQYCHRFYFACPKDMITPDELPEDVGLIYYNQQKDSIQTKRKAAYRDIEIPWEMLYYLVIARLESDRHPFFSSEREKMQAWVEDKEERKDLGLRVNRKIYELNRRIKDLERDIDLNKPTIQKAQRVENVLRQNGINPFNLEEDLEKALSQGKPPNLEKGLERIEQEVEKLKDIASCKQF